MVRPRPKNGRQQMDEGSAGMYETRKKDKRKTTNQMESEMQWQKEEWKEDSEKNGDWESED